MPSILEPFGTQHATNCLPEGSPKIDQKTSAKKFENGAKIGWFFRDGGHPKIITNALSKTPCAPRVSQASKSLPKAANKHPKVTKKRCKMLTPIIIPPPNYHLNADGHGGGISGSTGYFTHTRIHSQTMKLGSGASCAVAC